MFANRTKNSLLVILEIGIFYLSLLLTLIFRYGEGYREAFNNHFWPFTIILGIWVLVFYLFDLYLVKSFRNKSDLLGKIFGAVGISFIISIIAFYVFGSTFKLAPKLNLVIFSVTFAVLDSILRLGFLKVLRSKKLMTNVIFIGNSEIISETSSIIGANPEIGFRALAWIKDELTENRIRELLESIKRDRVEIVVLDPGIKKNPLAMRLAYLLLPLEVEVMDLVDFYESIFRKVPLSLLSEEWFVNEIRTKNKVYDFFKRLLDIVLSLALFLIFLPLGLLIALLVKLTSRGPVIYRQRRIGKNGTEFWLYKFRTMFEDAEKDGAKWAQEKDRRVTPIGRILRASHLDEFPQLVNILKGDNSFVGPRPERPEFTKLLEEKIPHYDIRHIIKPGLTGWAQINYRYGASVEDALEKLQHEIFYLKNRSLVLDLFIIIKTIRSFFVNK